MDNTKTFNDTVSDPVEDRSAYDCAECLGEGLDAREKVCAHCGGTGKKPEQQIDFGAFKPGTQVITKDGTFIISPTGEPIKQ